MRGIEEDTFWDEHWVLYGNQFVNKFHKKKKKDLDAYPIKPPRSLLKTILKIKYV